MKIYVASESDIDIFRKYAGTDYWIRCETMDAFATDDYEYIKVLTLTVNAVGIPQVMYESVPAGWVDEGNISREDIVRRCENGNCLHVIRPLDILRENEIIDR